jgi:hypothetical protein
MMELKRYQPLIVIHANYGVVVAPRRLIKKAIRRERTPSLNSLTFRRSDRGTDDFFLLVPENSFFAAVRIESSDGDPGPPDTKKIPQASVRQL